MKQKIWLTLITYLAYCINKELYKAIDYLKTQVEVLLEQQKKQNKRILLNNNQRIRIAAKARQLSRKMLEQCTVLFTPDTVMRWYHKLIAVKYDGSKQCGKPGRPPISQDTIDLVIRFKKDNPRWGYQKITDQIVYLGYAISKSTVKNILIEHGFNPEPDLTVRSNYMAISILGTSGVFLNSSSGMNSRQSYQMASSRSIRLLLIHNMPVAAGFVKWMIPRTIHR